MEHRSSLRTPRGGSRRRSTSPAAVSPGHRLPTCARSPVMSARLMSRSVSGLAGALRGSQISITPFSHNHLGRVLAQTGGGSSLAVLQPPPGRRVARSVGRRSVTRLHRRIALEQLLPISGAFEQHFLDVQQLPARSLDAGLDDRKIADADALPLHQLGGANADLQALSAIVPRQPALRPGGESPRPFAGRGRRRPRRRRRPSASRST